MILDMYDIVYADTNMWFLSITDMLWTLMVAKTLSLRTVCVHCG